MEIMFFSVTLIVAIALIEHMAWLRRQYHKDLTDLIDAPDEVAADVSADVAKVEADADSI